MEVFLHQLVGSFIPLFTRVLYIQGGWEWDFWTINSIYWGERSWNYQPQVGLSYQPSTGDFWSRILLVAIAKVPSWRSFSTLISKKNWVVVSNIFCFHPCLGRWSNLTNIFQMGWNNQLEYICLNLTLRRSKVDCWNTILSRWDAILALFVSLWGNQLEENAGLTPPKFNSSTLQNGGIGRLFFLLGG